MNPDWSSRELFARFSQTSVCKGSIPTGATDVKTVFTGYLASKQPCEFTLNSGTITPEICFLSVM